MTLAHQTFRLSALTPPQTLSKTTVMTPVVDPSGSPTYAGTFTARFCNNVNPPSR